MESSCVLPGFDPALWQARRLCYRLAALALSDPRAGGWSHWNDSESRLLVRQAAALLRDEEAAVARPLALGERPLGDLAPELLFNRLPPTWDDLNTLYERNFGLLSGSKCPPYETEYVPSKFVFQRSNSLADVAGYYLAFGLQASTQQPERPDHIALEMEFMAQLVQLEIAARQGDDAESCSQGDICLAAQERFLREHVIWWMPAFCTLLRRQSPDGFYDAVSSYVAALVAAERALFGLAAPHLAPEPSPLEEPDACSGCELAAQ